MNSGKCVLCCIFRRGQVYQERNLQHEKWKFKFSDAVGPGRQIRGTSDFSVSGIIVEIKSGSRPSLHNKTAALIPSAAALKMSQ